MTLPNNMPTQCLCALYTLLPTGRRPAQQRAWRHPHPVQQEPAGQALSARHSTQPTRPVRHSQPGVLRLSGSGPVQCNSGKPCWYGRPCPTHRVPYGDASWCTPGSSSNGSSGGCGNTGDGWERSPVWASWHNADVRLETITGGHTVRVM